MEPTIRIKFADHISDSWQEGVLEEVRRMGGNITRIGPGEFYVELGRSSRSPFLISFLEQEGQSGTLKLHVEEDQG